MDLWRKVQLAEQTGAIGTFQRPKTWESRQVPAGGAGLGTPLPSQVLVSAGLRTDVTCSTSLHARSGWGWGAAQTHHVPHWFVPFRPS